jgi:hypothetical protein
MLFERRAYTLRPGCADAFWALQRRWNTPTSWRPLLERNIGYFFVAAGPAECVVHLYRWDDYDDGKRRVAAVSTPDRAEYFAAARALILRQETWLLDRAPVAPLTPLWDGQRDWLPSDPAFEAPGEPSTFTVSETVLDFVPGGLPAYWDICKNLDGKTLGLMRTGLIGVFYVTTGQLHRAVSYRWHRSFAEAEDFQRQLAENAPWNAFIDSYRATVAASHVSHMRPSPVPWMRPLFAKIDWTT